MRTLQKQNQPALLLLLCITVLFASCLTSKRLDKYVAEQYNNELPQPDKKKKADVVVTAATPASGTAISSSVRKTDAFLPLIIYWKYKHRQVCTLNSAIATTQFSNTLNAMASRGLAQKLTGEKLELTVEQVPAAFSIVINEQMVVPVYPITWTKVYIEPDFKDLIVSYKVTSANQTLKIGSITIKNTDKSNGLNFFQSWKSATSEYLSNYDANLTAMTKSFVEKLTQEL